MVFSSLLFLFVFLPIFLLVYFILPRRFKNVWLLLCSLVFYAWGEPVYILLMLFSTAVDYTLGYLVQMHRGERKAKAFVIASICVNLSLLGFFKYFDFLVTSVPFLNISPLGLSLPIGISFYTFQSMSYTIDVYRKDAQAQRSFVDFAAFVTMFPQLIAGPIVKYKSIAEELGSRRESADMFGEGARLFICGLAKKVLLANNIGLLWDAVLNLPGPSMSVALSWAGLLAFAFQIYFDFSGYSDMAMGLGRMLGFHLPQNFNYPYASKSVTEFWRRWHISLSTWFRDYVYIPLGGNRKGEARTYINLLIVWALTGLWHGADWNFLLWGLYFAVILILEKAFLLRAASRLPAVFQHAYALILIAFGWVLFAFSDLGAAGEYVSLLFGLSGAPLWNGASAYWILSYLPLLAVLTLASTPLLKRIYLKLPAKAYVTAAEAGVCAVVLLMCTAYLVDSTYNPFLYFRF